MKLTDLEKNLVRAMEEMTIIDAHEHLGPESQRTDATVDVFTLFSHYTRDDLLVARMSHDDYNKLFDRTIPLEARWALFAPYYERIRHGSYARAARIAARAFYDVDDISDRTYVTLSERMREANKPGLYDRVLRDACRIKVALTQCGSTDLGGSSMLRPVMPMAYPMERGADLTRPPFDPEASIGSLDDYLDAMRAYVDRVKAQGAVGLKMFSNPYEAPSREEAASAFSRVLTGEYEELPPVNPLRDFVVDEVIRYATELGLVVCVHTGYWGDFRMLDPTHMIPVLQRHPDARFDIYHLGYPWMREAIMLGKGFTNVWLNLCWTHIISQRFAMAGLDELIDMVPMNKIIGFGGDYGLPVEKVYGHLVMAREDIARVLARRVEDGDFSEERAIQLAHTWLYENPTELYGLE